MIERSTRALTTGISMRRAIFGALFLLLAAASAASAGPVQEGARAFNRHDYGRAARIFLPLAWRGDAQAQTYLGFLYAQGHGLPQSYVKAAYWYRRAAEQGNATAQYWLGLMYDKGHGVPPNVIEAYKWLNLAVARAATRRERDSWLPIRDALASKMDSRQIAEGQRLAVQWRPRRERPVYRAHGV
jgi:TPR repeat protein